MIWITSQFWLRKSLSTAVTFSMTESGRNPHYHWLFSAPYGSRALAANVGRSELWTLTALVTAFWRTLLYGSVDSDKKKKKWAYREIPMKDLLKKTASYWTQVGHPPPPHPFTDILEVNETYKLIQKQEHLTSLEIFQKMRDNKIGDSYKKLHQCLESGWRIWLPNITGQFDRVTSL